jgi:nucleoside-diphosphate-sugar epimerase
MEGSTYIVHTASPFPIEKPKDENVLIKPAVEGTLAVMKAARLNKVKRVVVTSSIASIFKTGVEG